MVYTMVPSKAFCAGAIKERERRPARRRPERIAFFMFLV
jgi:hypothetical protein